MKKFTLFYTINRKYESPKTDTCHDEHKYKIIDDYICHFSKKKDDRVMVVFQTTLNQRETK